MGAESKGNNGAHRPTKYKEEYAGQARNYCLLGATDDDLAEFFDVTQKTINNWKKAQVLFLQAIKEGKDVADAKVAASLYDRATGYCHRETKVFCNNGEITTHDVDKHYPPDAASAIFWLKNRSKSKWRDKQEHEHSGDLGITFDLNYGLQKDLGISRED